MEDAVGVPEGDQTQEAQQGHAGGAAEGDGHGQKADEGTGGLSEEEQQEHAGGAAGGEGDGQTADKGKGDLSEANADEHKDDVDAVSVLFIVHASQSLSLLSPSYLD